MGAYVTINPTPSGDITGSGTAGYLAMFTSANVIGDSTINQDSGNTGVGMLAAASAGFGITTTAATSGTKTGFYFLQTGNTGQAASTEANGVLWSMGTRQWATGAITAQREFYIGSCAYSFVAASTITNAYGLYVEAATAGTNATITNNYGLGLNGSMSLVTAGNGIFIKEGSNATLGAETIVYTGAGAAQDQTVNTTKVTANSRIILTVQSTSETATTNVPLPFVLSRVAGTSFTIRFTSDVNATYVVAWVIIEPTP